ncbi:MAG: molecular chaperone Tir [Spirulinaceae cyanobacterium RM2_2_10]|nr:molecular chaperone Tir [Spirulinaceae cyanobacterium SM2_1_0]NJO19924.1 molecular chaperone Tir [Spirulinaceae cyanobacterium RM2_2_10]
MRDTIRASELGLGIVEIARRKKGWTRTSTPLWWDLARTSRATLRRFWRGIAIQRDAFEEICRVVGIRDWQLIADDWLWPENLTLNLEALYWWAVGQHETATRLAPGLIEELRRLAKPLPATTQRLTVLYCTDPESEALARHLQLGLLAAGYTLSLAGDRQRQGLTWVQRLSEEFVHCEGLLLLLSNVAARSEWLTDAVRQAREQQVNHEGKPCLLPIRVGSGAVRLNYDLQGYLIDRPVWSWQDERDTPGLLQRLCQQLQSDQRAIAPPSFSEPLAPLLPDSQPSPSAEPELQLEHPGGQVNLDSRFYIPRPPSEDEAIAAILQPGALIRIKAPRQMGKTSLMARILQRGRQADYNTVPLSFQLADSPVFSDLERLLQWFCASVGRRLGLSQRPRETWDAMYSSKENCTIYFEDHVLPNLTQPLVLGLDEVDRVFQHPAIAADFFSLLRAWYDAGRDGDRPHWQHLRLVVVHSTEVYVPLALNRSPFNVGLPVVLPELTGPQVQQLAALHGLSGTAADCEALMAMVGGHPYLIRLALYHVARGYQTLPALLTTAPTEAGIYGDHLRRHLWQLEQHPELAEAMEDVAVTETPVRLETAIAFKLHSMGLVHWAGSHVVPRCELYRRYFQDRFGAS